MLKHERLLNLMTEWCCKEKCCSIFFLILFLLGSAIMLILGLIVVLDYRQTDRNYRDAFCSGKTKNVTIETSGLCAQAEIQTHCCSPKSFDECAKFVYNPPCSVSLYYPPIQHWLIVCKSRHEVQNWIDSINPSVPFPCRVFDGNGITDLLPKNEVIGWYIMMCWGATVMAILCIVCRFGCCWWCFES